MDTLECLMTRRTVRRFTEEAVTDEELTKMLEAARFAPSWANTQCVEWIRVDDAKQRAALQECLPKGNPARRAIVDAPMLLALCAKRGKAGFYKGQAASMHDDWYMFDAGIASQNLVLAAWALGYASVHVGLLDHRKAGQVLDLPEDVQLLELIPLGRPAKVPEAPERRPLAELVHVNRYGQGGTS